jgi:hypothetical protein
MESKITAEQLTNTTAVIIHSTYRLMACLGEPSSTSMTVRCRLGGWVSGVVTSGHIGIKNAPLWGA